jgi:hypothetical protein
LHTVWSSAQGQHWNHDPPTNFSCWDGRCIPPHPVYWLRWGLATFFFLPRLALNLHPPYLCLLSSWDYRQESQCPVALWRWIN